MSAPAPPAPDDVLVELLFTEDGRQDPYPRYHALRTRAPVLRSGFGPIVLTRYDDCQNALRDPKLGRGLTAAMRPDLSPDELERRRARQARSMLFSNPPDHTRLRRLVSREFTPSRVDAMRPAILAMVDAICDRMADEREVDAMAVLAFPLPVNVIGELLGVPEADRPAFQPLVRKTIASLEFYADAAAEREAQIAADELARYFGRLLAERRAAPRDDLLSALATATDRDDRLTEEEVVGTAILLFAAGFETTTNLIGNGLAALLSHPDQLAHLRSHPDATPGAIEEILRWDSPVQLNGRVALEATNVSGEAVNAGQPIVCLQGAANRDPDRFADPDRFDITRAEGPPLSFGSGIHYCLGAGLARTEGHVVFRRLLDRFASIDGPDTPPGRRPGLTLRGLADLHVRMTPT